MSTTKKLAALLGAGVLSIAMFGTALAGGPVVYATVDGHEAFSSDANAEDYWGDDCTSEQINEDTYLVEADWDLIIVKSGSGPFANTIFEDVSAGETVFADTDGDGVYTPFEAGEGDQQISHIIFCDEEDATEPPVTDEPEFSDDQGGDTDAPSEPNTATIGGNGTSGPADGAWLLVVALGVLLASVVVMTPARAKNRR